MATIYFGKWTTVARVLGDPDYKKGNFTVCDHLAVRLGEAGHPWIDPEHLGLEYRVFAGPDYDYDSACDGEVYVCDTRLDISCGCHAPDDALDECE